MWIMVVKRPYYPSVEPHETYEGAIKAAAEWIAENTPIDPPGLYEATVYVAEVHDELIARCDY